MYKNWQTSQLDNILFVLGNASYKHKHTPTQQHIRQKPFDFSGNNRFFVCFSEPNDQEGSVFFFYVILIWFQAYWISPTMLHFKEDNGNQKENRVFRKNRFRFYRRIVEKIENHVKISLFSADPSCMEFWSGEDRPTLIYHRHTWMDLKPLKRDWSFSTSAESSLRSVSIGTYTCHR